MLMIAQSFAAIALGGFILASAPAPVMAQGKASCSSVCETRCQSSRLGRGECMLRCTKACEDNRKRSKS
jgi:hypothetical protein